MRGAPPSDRGPTIDDIPEEFLFFDQEETKFAPGSPETGLNEKRRRKRKKSKSAHGYLISDILLKSDEDDDGDVIKKMMSRSNQKRGGGDEKEMRKYRSDLLDYKKCNEGLPALRKIIQNSKKSAAILKRNKERKISSSKDKKEEVKTQPVVVETPAKTKQVQNGNSPKQKVQFSNANQFSENHFPTLGTPARTPAKFSTPSKAVSPAIKTPSSSGKYKKMSQKQKKRMQQEQMEMEQQEKIFGVSQSPPPNAWGIPKFVGDF